MSDTIAADFNPDTWRRQLSAGSRRHPDMDVEDRIVATLVVDLLAHNVAWNLGVLDEAQEGACKPTRDPAEILAAMFSTSEDWLTIHAWKDEKPLAWVRLIGGNGCDIISDYTTNIPETVMARANAIAAQYQ